MRMHDAEVAIGHGLVTALLADQFPRLAGLPVVEVRPPGTVNAVYRVGDGWCVRLPRTAEWAAGLEREWAWLPRIARHVSLRVPEPVALGKPSEAYPFVWAVYRWIEGERYAVAHVPDEVDAAERLAGFVTDLRTLDPAGAPAAGRRPLAELDRPTREAIHAARGMVDADAALAAWDQALTAPGWRGPAQWVHADLLRPNLLVRGGRLYAVLDFGGAGVGDPASDVAAAWSVFGPAGRAAYRRALDADDGTWLRARGLALHQAALIIPYYARSNPDFAADARRTVEQLLADAAR